MLNWRSSVESTVTMYRNARTSSSLPEGWTWTTIGNSANILDKHRAPINATDRAARVDGKPLAELYPYYGATGQVGWIDDYLFDEELVLLGEDGAPFLDRAKNTAYVIRGKTWVNNHAHVLRAMAGLMQNAYLCHYLNAFDFHEYVTGTTRLKLNQSRMRSMPIALPPLPEQHRIVDAIETQFTRLDAAVAALQRVKANLARYKASVLAAACEGRLVPTEAELAHAEGRDYEPADVLLQRILRERRKKWEADQWQKEIARAQKKAAQAKRKAAGQPSSLRAIPAEEWEAVAEEDYARYLPKNDKWKQKYKKPAVPDTEELPELPEGWAWTNMHQAAEHRLGKMLDKGKNTGTLRPYLRNLNVRWFDFNLSDIQHMRVRDEELANVSVREGDLVICEGGEPGRAAVWRRQGPMVIQKALHRVRLHPSISPEYINIRLASDANSGNLERHFTGSTIRHFTGQSLRSYTYPLPPVAEQHLIVAEVERRLSVIAGIERTVDAGLNRAARLRQSILKRAFEGKLVPQDPSDEPALVLLERIRAGRG